MVERPDVLMLGPDPSALGGIATLQRDLLASDALRGLRVLHVTTRGGGRRLLAPGEALRAARAVRGSRPAVVHAHVADGGSVPRKLALAALVDAPLVLHGHFGRLRAMAADRTTAALLRRALDRADHLVTVSAVMAEQLRGLGVRRPMTVLHNGVALARWRALPLPPGPPRFLFVGALERRKGLDDLYAAWPSVRAAQPQASLRIIGGGDVGRWRRRAPPGVLLSGPLSGAPLAEAFAAAHVVCLPSHSEGLPLAVLEALAAGRGVVSTEVDGIPEAITDGVEGLLVPAREPVRLAQAMLDAWAGAESLGAAARRRAERDFDIEAVARRLQQLWSSLAGPEASPPRP